MKERIIFQNEACLVINKLPGESSEFPDLDPSGEKEKFPFPVQRLDVPVSGCLLIARTREAAAFLGAAFAGHEGGVEKRYWAIVEKTPAAGSLLKKAELVHWLGVDKKTNKAFSLAEEKPGLKKAVSRYRVLGEGDRYLFLEVNLVTGRHHQIRSQLAAIGLYIKGDLKYGAKRSEKSGGIRLHAFSLAFPNPLDPAETIRVQAPPPFADSLWLAFAKEAGAGSSPAG